MTGAALAAPEPPPPILLSYQQEAVRLSHQHQLLVIEKSRRTGITYAFGADDTLTAAERGIGGSDVYYIAYNLDMAREYIGYVGDFAKAFHGLSLSSRSCRRRALPAAAAAARQAGQGAARRGRLRRCARRGA